MLTANGYLIVMHYIRTTHCMVLLKLTSFENARVKQYAVFSTVRQSTASVDWLPFEFGAHWSGLFLHRLHNLLYFAERKFLYNLQAEDWSETPPRKENNWTTLRIFTFIKFRLDGNFIVLVLRGYWTFLVRSKQIVKVQDLCLVKRLLYDSTDARGAEREN